VTFSEQERLLNDLAQALVVLDGRVYLAQRVLSGRVPGEKHLAEMQNCVRRMMQSLQLIHHSEQVGEDPIAPLP